MGGGFIRRGWVKLVITGNHAVSYGAKLARAEVIAAYPITPQTEVVEKLSTMVANKELKAKFIKVESEHSAMAACIGASAVGARSFTATSSQGLALMHEMLHWAANARLPVVMANINRAMGPPWNIWSDQTDSLAQRDTGWLQFYCENNQEILDTIIQSYKVCEKVLLPGMVVLDAFILSHTSEPVEIPPQKLIDEYLPAYNPKYKLDVKDPHTFGGLTSPDLYYELRYKIQNSMEDALSEIKRADSSFKRKFGRGYGLVEEYRARDADTLLIVSGSMSSTAKVAVDMMREKGERAGLLRIRVFRPFPKDEIRRVVRRGVKRIGVIDRNISFGSEGIFFQEVKSALCNEKRKVPIYGFVAGLGGRDVTVEDIINIKKSIKSNNRLKDIIWVGVKK
ncbi:MAG: pyruvate ferredoxin oxidoreductase [Candidatus Omnitrophica bacterium]|nr:pyruvate ferredoxin oxidoreductase [Candidatus Omnitrophota bacterium]